MEQNHLFPIFLKLDQLQVLVVGGGNVGCEKVGAILNNCPNARVTVVATWFAPEMAGIVEGYSNITLVEKAFSCGDIFGKDLVIAATADKELNHCIWEKAKAAKVLVNVADTPALCDFYLSSVVQKGNLKIAISTNGKSPTIAKRLKEVLNEAIPEGLESVLHHLHAIRDRLIGDFSEKVRKLNELTSVLVGKGE